MKFFVIFAFLTFVCGCARHQPDGMPPDPDCKSLYVLLPDNYVIDLAAGSSISLNPAMHEFIVFCSAQEAREAREKAISQGLLSGESRWLVYALEGEPADLAIACHEGALCLKSSAVVNDWQD